ncbi:MAG TPA: hypothetical protein VEQ11_21420 [Chloroflexota bacterium]|nr:hypothetical protein [Chloroflexota bacterium]
MTVTSPDAGSEYSAAPEPPGPLVRLFGAICSIRSVRRVGITLDGGPLDFWVFTRGQTHEDEQRIYLNVRAYRATPRTAALDLHVISLDDVDEQLIPAVDILFER